MSERVIRRLGIGIRLMPVVFITAVPFFVFRKVWATSAANAKYFHGDTNGLYWPDLIFLYRALSKGFLPLWNPYDRGGYPYCADPESGLLYPVNWLIALFGLVLGDVPFWLMQAKVFFHLCLAGCGMVLFLRQRGLSNIAATTGGVVFQLGPYMMHNAHFSLIWPVAWLPWLLLATDRLYEKATFGKAFIWAILVGLICVAGSPPSMFYSAFIAAPYFVFRGFDRNHLRSIRNSKKRTVVLLGSAVVLALIFALPVLLPGMVLTEQSRLAEKGFGYVASGSIVPAQLLGLVLRSGSQLYFYTGVLAFALSVYGVTSRIHRRDVCFFLVLVLIGVLLALGRHTPLLRIASEVVPGMSQFRLAFRYLFLLNVGLAVLCAVGVDTLVSATTAVKVLHWVFGFLLLSLGSFIIFSMVNRELVAPRRVVELAFAGLLLLLCWITILISQRWPSARLLLIALLLQELSTAALTAGTLRNGRFDPKPLLDDEQVARLRRMSEGYRIYDEFVLRWRGGTRYAMRDFRGYMHPLVLNRYNQLMKEIPKHPELLALFNVKYLLHARHPYHGLSHNRIKNPKRIKRIRRIDRHIFRLPNATPFAYWVGKIRLYPNDKKVQAKLHKIDSEHEVALAKDDLSSARLSDINALSSKQYTRVQANLVERHPNRITMSITVPASGLLVINEAWFPGWNASVDGRHKEVLRANSMMQAVAVKAGQHLVVLRFRPYYFLVPCLIALLCLILAGTYLTYSRFRINPDNSPLSRRLAMYSPSQHFRFLHKHRKYSLSHQKHCDVEYIRDPYTQR